MKLQNIITWNSRDGSRRKLEWDVNTEKWRAYKSPVAIWLQHSLDDEDFLMLNRRFGKHPRRELRAMSPIQ